MDALLWKIIEAELAADEAGELLTEDDLTPVSIEDGVGGVFEVFPDGSYCLKVDGELR